jgi:UDP-N-acetylmuramoylalanine--D-glutamate ligase
VDTSARDHLTPPWLPHRALVVGLGRSGSAAALALARAGADVVAADRGSEAPADAERLAGAGVELRLATEEESLLHAVDLMIKSPGVPRESPLPSGAARLGIPIWSEIELGYRLLRGNPLVGITGTKGKTTTARLLASILEAADRPVALAGNEHTPLCEVAMTVDAETAIVCELSSFQLEDVHELACDVAVLLNLEPDHLDRYANFEAYRDAKLRIFERAHAAIVPRGSGLPGTEFAAGDPLPAEPSMPGLHNRANAAAATAVARALDIADDAIARGLQTFAGVPHRLETVRELRGVRYVNDSKATNTAAARRAVTAYDAPLHLILGGSLKGEDFTQLANELPATVRMVYLIGEATDVLARALDVAGKPYIRSGDLATAVRAAADAAYEGEIVLLSPACASFDQFANFEERGDTFRRLVGELE